jgi:hypothetical protein
VSFPEQHARCTLATASDACPIRGRYFCTATRTVAVTPLLHGPPGRACWVTHTAQRFAIYIVISIPNRRSIAHGVSHFISISLKTVKKTNGKHGIVVKPVHRGRNISLFPRQSPCGRLRRPQHQGYEHLFPHRQCGEQALSTRAEPSHREEGSLNIATKSPSG